MTHCKHLDLNHFTFIDLTHSLSPSIPHWSGKCGFNHSIIADYSDSKEKTKFRVQEIKMFAGIGTHIDAPLHCFPRATDVADIPLSQLISPCIVIDVSHKANEHYSISVEDIKNFESQYGTINSKSFVIFHTGWGKLWNTPEKYHNNLVFPTVSVQATELLLKRDIVGLGVDTLSPDNEKDGFPVHHLILDEGKYIIENIANVSSIPIMGASTIALPLKIEDGTEAPIRLIAAVAKGCDS